MSKNALYGSTDYPFVSLGDKEGHHAPRRNIKVISYDRNKYAVIVVYAGKGITTTAEIKTGYIRPFDWKKRKRRTYHHSELCALPSSI